ncbi:hypothetical protein NDU88_008424 [Pleurodeles waltl]|uniref:Uncharacterized protein n=1 Tax=Pleurodeles waltl TaxID=8319 RepID=A0AAV7N6D9_PLEWA|nr:hypothetical protein NDU88_008424 [Pleurodeles waltl]
MDVMDGVDDVVRRNAERSQKLQKQYFDTRKRVSQQQIEVGDVRIKAPVHIRKGVTKYYEPKVVDNICENAIRVGKKSWWNKSRVYKVKNTVTNEENGSWNLNAHVKLEAVGEARLVYAVRAAARHLFYE